MNGQQVACPHCHVPATIQLGGAPPQPTPEIATETQELSPPIDLAIDVDKQISRKRKKSLGKNAKSKEQSSIDADLLPPTRQPETPAPEQKNPAGPAPLPSAPTPQSLTAAANAGAATPIVPKLRTADPSPTSQELAGAQAPSSPKVPTTADQQPPQDQTTADTDTAKPDSRRSIAHLLPPVFDVFDPERVGVAKDGDNFKVFLPDGKGGTAQIDNRILRVKHGEKEISLVSMSDKQRAKKRLIQNVIAILIGIAVIALAITILV